MPETMSRIDLNSTSLAAAAYSDGQYLLELQFRSGAIYHYFSVPPEIYGALLRAPSQGAYFNQGIRDRFAYAKICPEPATPTPTPSSDSTPLRLNTRVHSCPNR
jgi:KTSC domain